MALLLVFGLGLVATTLLTGLGSLGSRSAAFRLANLAASAGVNVGMFLAAGGYLVGHNLRHAAEVYGFFAVVLGLLSWLCLGSELTLYAAEVNVVLARRLWPRSLLPPPLTGPDQRTPTDLATQEERRPEESVQVSFTGQVRTPGATGPGPLAGAAADRQASRSMTALTSSGWRCRASDSGPGGAGG